MAEIQPALNFLASNSLIKSTLLTHELLLALRAQSDIFGMFMVPINRNVLSYTGALKWVAYLHSREKTQPADLVRMFDAIASQYDYDHAETVTRHTPAPAV
jgi:hypothetical protein